MTLSLNRLAVVGVAAALLVGSTASSGASNGDEVRLGFRNTERTATKIFRTEPGPVLSLRTDTANSAPFRTNGNGKVLHLNADRVDGRHASELATRVQTFRAGVRGQLLVGGVGLWQVDIEPGLYTADFQAAAFVEVADPQTQFATVICGVVDLTSFGTENTRIYAAQSGLFTGDAPAILSGAATIRISAESDPGLVCFTPAGDLRLFQPIIASFSNVDHRTYTRATRVTVDAKAIAKAFNR